MRQFRVAGPCSPQLVYMGFDTAAARAALRVFRGNVQLAAQTLAHNGGSLPPDLQLAADDPPSTPSMSLSDSAGRPALSQDPPGAHGGGCDFAWAGPWMSPLSVARDGAAEGDLDPAVLPWVSALCVPLP